MDKEVQEVLKGNCIVYPTSTLPALGCALTSKSLDELYRIKKRPNEMIVIVHHSENRPGRAECLREPNR